VREPVVKGSNIEFRCEFSLLWNLAAMLGATVDGGTLTAPEALEQLLSAQIQLRTTGGCRRPCAPATCPRSSSSGTSTAPSAVAPPRANRESARARLRRTPRERDLPRAARRGQNASRDQPRDRGRAERAAGYYGTLADLITSLEEAQAAGWLQARLKALTHPAPAELSHFGPVLTDRHQNTCEQSILKSSQVFLDLILG
jgi:hypothetical protein